MDRKITNIYYITNEKRLDNVCRVLNRTDKKLFLCIVAGVIYTTKLYNKQQKEIDDIRREIDKLKGR